VEKPIRTLGIGVDALPKSIRSSNILTGNDLGMLGNVEQLPTVEEISELKITSEMSTSEEIHKKAQKLLSEGNTKEALLMLLAKDSSEK